MKHIKNFQEFIREFNSISLSEISDQGLIELIDYYFDDIKNIVKIYQTLDSKYWKIQIIFESSSKNSLDQLVQKIGNKVKQIGEHYDLIQYSSDVDSKIFRNHYLSYTIDIKP